MSQWCGGHTGLFKSAPPSSFAKPRYIRRTILTSLTRLSESDASFLEQKEMSREISVAVAST